jgi:hypothetical protein
MMISRNLLRFFRHPVAVLAFFCASPVAFAQGPALFAIPDAPTASETEAMGVIATAPVTSASHVSIQHPFWDRQNVALFAASAALSGADFAVTRSNLQSGGRELNPVVRMFGRSNAGLALNFAGETAAIVCVSYFFHRTGHHKLERAVSMMNIGSSAAAVSYGIASR